MTFRLDRVANDAFRADLPAHVSANPDAAPRLAIRLREQIGEEYGVRADRIVLAPGMHAMHQALADWYRDIGPTVLFPPDDPAFDEIYRDAVHVSRQAGFRLPLDVPNPGIPAGALAVLTSPNELSGRITTVPELVRLLRLARYVVIDERNAAYSSRRLAPLVSEWDSLIVLETNETFAGVTDEPVAWGIMPASVATEVAARLDLTSISANALLLAALVMEDMTGVRAAARDVAREKGRLYRELRKLGIVSVPYPSWGNFLLARVELGDRDAIVTALRDRGIEVYVPPHANLRQHIRISAVSEDATLKLRRALQDIALSLGESVDS